MMKVHRRICLSKRCSDERHGGWIAEEQLCALLVLKDKVITGGKIRQRSNRADRISRHGLRAESRHDDEVSVLEHLHALRRLEDSVPPVPDDRVSEQNEVLRMGVSGYAQRDHHKDREQCHKQEDSFRRCVREKRTVERIRVQFSPARPQVSRTWLPGRARPAAKTHTLETIRELDEPYGGEGARLTWRQMTEHLKLINDADLAYPIILSATGEVMDGRHRIAKAAMTGRDVIEAVQFEIDPPPDYIGREPDELPY